MKSPKYLNKHRLLIGAVLVGFFASSPASAYDAFKMRVLGGFGNQTQMDDIERPFFEKALPAASGGKITSKYRGMDEVGLKGFEGMRLLKLGVFDVMEIQIGYVSGDEPFFLGIDQLGTAPDLKTLREIVEAYKPYFDERLQKKFNGKALAFWPFTAQMVYCNVPINGLSDLKGKKVRVYSPALSAFVEAFGGVSVTISFPEVYQALQRKVVDCAISGSTAGNKNKWPEVTSHLFPLTLLWAMQAHVVNLDFWNSIPADAQQFLVEQFKSGLEEPLWQMADETTQDGINCNLGRDCKAFTKYNMKEVKVTAEDVKRLGKAVEGEVLPDWIADCKRTYPECVDVWNKTVGKVTGIMAK